ASRWDGNLPKKCMCLLFGHAIWTRKYPFRATGFSTVEFKNPPVTSMMRRYAEIFNGSAGGYVQKQCKSLCQ
ncbi:MAG: hypothetical protein WA728_13375, partial [Xanthobacteraceae bacterium]